MLPVLCFFALVLSARSASAPFIKPCKNGDSACLTESGKAAFPVLVAGVPELGVKTMDPLKLPLIKSDENGLKLTFTDSVLTGAKGCTLEGLKSDLEKMKQSITMKCNLDLQGQYKLGGRLLILPVQGEGKYKIELKDIVLKVVIDLATSTDADGKQHWRVSKWKHSYQVKDHVRFTFENLFNGNKALADPVLKFANENWKDVMQEIAPPIIRMILSEIVDAVDVLYKAVPAEELLVS